CASGARRAWLASPAAAVPSTPGSVAGKNREHAACPLRAKPARSDRPRNHEDRLLLGLQERSPVQPRNANDVRDVADQTASATVRREGGGRPRRHHSLPALSSAV